MPATCPKSDRVPVFSPLVVVIFMALVCSSLWGLVVPLLLLVLWDIPSGGFWGVLRASAGFWAGSYVLGALDGLLVDMRWGTPRRLVASWSSGRMSAWRAGCSSECCSLVVGVLVSLGGGMPLLGSSLCLTLRFVIMTAMLLFVMVLPLFWSNAI